MEVVLNDAVTRPVARRHAPGPAVAGAVRAYLSRRAVGSSALRSAFPVNPFCTLTWFWGGGAAAVRAAGAPLQDLAGATVVFSGPYDRPSEAWSTSASDVLVVVLASDVVHALTGVDLAAWVNRSAPLGAALGADWAEVAEAVSAAPDDAARIAVFEAFLGPRVGRRRPLGRYDAWARSLRGRAADAGRGQRQVARRIKRWCGLSLRELRAMGDAERLFLGARAAERDGRLDWARLAIATGFADQPHVCRATRRASGCTPTELQRRIREDEAFWVYRVW